MLLQLAMIFQAAVGSGDPLSATTIQEQVDLIEFNHHFDETGKHVYDQLIFYEWSSVYHRFHVRAWCLVEPGKSEGRVPMRNPASGIWSVRWFDDDQSALRILNSGNFIETWGQIDPERANCKYLPKKQRTRLVQRNLKPTPENRQLASDQSALRR